ncbi:MAG TPA: hypothetical protein VFR41_12690, partial [Acidimicrobiia bacterium]|nr:hypothetical protein [Acidimicrobiia bacterium]
MRRIAVATLIGGAIVVAGAAPASAHICAPAAEIPVGPTAAVIVGVTVENATVPDVEVPIPSGLKVAAVDPAAGWRVRVRRTSVRWRGGPIEPYGCQYFTMHVSAAARGVYPLTIVLRDARGATLGTINGPPTQPVVYAGMPAPKPAGT